MPGTGNNRRNAGMTMTSGKDKKLPTIQALTARPAYSQATLADLLRGETLPGGRRQYKGNQLPDNTMISQIDPWTAVISGPRIIAQTASMKDSSYIAITLAPSTPYACHHF